MAREQWPALKQTLAEIFRTRTRDEWDEIMLGTDICYAPVLAFHEAAQHPHNKARDTFVEVDGVVQAAPAPRFDRTPPEVPAAAAKPGEHTDDILKDAGLSAADIAALRASGAVA
jgi:alpha-methylacyl-CoA racemase